MRSYRQTVAEWAFILLAPVAAYAAFKIRLSTQAREGYVDAWFYTGFAQDPALMFEQFGWNYYALRFPVIFLSHLFNQVLGDMEGYTALRYVIVVGVGGLLFVWARRNFGVGIAALSYLFLLCNPYFPRLLLWDWVQYMAIPLALAGMLVWYMPTQRPEMRAASVGFLFASAIAVHFFVVTAVGLFMLIECLALVRTKRPSMVLRELLAMLLGGAACVALGFVYMAIVYRAFDPMQVYTTLSVAIKAGQGFVASHASTFLSWGTRLWYGYVPLVLVISAGLMLGREALRTSIEARVWQFACAYTAFYWFYQLTRGYIIESPLYFFSLTIAVYLLLPVWLALALRKMGDEQSTRRTIVLLLAGVVLVGAPLVNRIWPALYDDILAAAQRSTYLFILLALFVVCLTIGLWRGAARSRGLLAMACIPLLVACLQVMVFTDWFFREPFSEGRSREAAWRRAAVDLFSIYKAHATREKKMVNWLTKNEPKIQSIASIVLINNLGGHWDSEGLPEFGERQKAHVNAPSVQYILAVSEDRQRIEAGENALKDNGIRFEVARKGTLGEGEFQPHFRLFKILR